MSLRWSGVEARVSGIFILGEDGEHVVTDRQGHNAVMPEGWTPTRALNIGQGLAVVFFEHPSGRYSGWLVSDQFQVKCDLARAKEVPGYVEIQKVLTKALLDEAPKLLTARSELIQAEQPPRSSERKLLAQLLACVDLTLICALRPLAEFAKEDPISSEALHACAATFADFKRGIVAPDDVPSALHDKASVVHIRHIPLEYTLQETAHLCWAGSSNLPVVVLLNGKRRQLAAFVYCPERQVIFGDDFSEQALDCLNRQLAGVFLSIISSSALPPGGSYRHTDQSALMLTGKAHLAHGIWDDLQAVDRALERKEDWARLPLVYVRNGSGAAVYAPLEDCYPELAGRFVYLDSVQEIASHALSHGIQLFRPNGRGAPRATRDRLTRVARRHGELHRLAQRAAMATDGILEQRPTIVFGLRLSNRHPVDPIGFYVRLTEALVKKFGSISIIFDGMNVDSTTGQVAARIVNGSPNNSGRSEVDIELDFVRQFRASVANLPVQILNCVGLSIRDNLFWLSKADFFVAPNGAGLAKLRWALDVSGYVLTSRINFKYCSLVNLYGDRKETEEPFRPIYMNLPEEVEDIPVQPPRQEAIRRRLVPYPETFVLKEDTVIPRICDLVQVSLEQKAAD